jgi:site-specific DNA-cytosine methylase
MRDAGYDVAWQILDAADFGVPQHRRRILCFGQRRPIWSRDGKIWIENANTRKIAVLSEDKFKVFAKKELPEQINILTKIAESIGGKE